MISFSPRPPLTALCTVATRRAEPVYVCGGEAALADRRVPEEHGLPRATVRDQPHLRGSQGSRAPPSVCLCACPADGYPGTGCIAGLSCRATAPSSCSNRSNSGFSACFGTCPSLSTSADLYTSRSAGSQAGSVTALASVCLVWHAVSCTIELQCAPALCRLVDWSQYGWCWTSLGGTDWSPRLFPCTPTSLPPRLTCVFASTR